MQLRRVLPPDVSPEPAKEGHAANVKNWKDGMMALRWCAAGMAEATKQFRRVNGFLHLSKLRTALERHVAAQSPTLSCYNENVA